VAQLPAAKLDAGTMTSVVLAVLWVPAPLFAPLIDTVFLA
jgi:hypothetical protein